MWTLSCDLLQVGLLLAIILSNGCCNYASPEAEKAFEARSELFSGSIYPVSAIHPTIIYRNIKLSQSIVTFLKTEELANPVFLRDSVRYTFEPIPNQA